MPWIQIRIVITYDEEGHADGSCGVSGEGEAPGDQAGHLAQALRTGGNPMKKTLVLTIIMLLCFYWGSVSQAVQSGSDLLAAWKIIQSKKIVDMTKADFAKNEWFGSCLSR